MSLEELKKSLLQEAKAEAGRIISKAEKEAQEKLKAAKAEAAKTVAEAKERAERQAAAERAERLSAIQLKAKKLTSEAQNKVLQQGLGKIWNEFSALPEDKATYEKLVKRLISHAENDIGKGAVVKVNRRDQALAKRLSKNVSAEDAEIAGGAIVTSSDGSISIDNSLESIFAQKEDELRKFIYLEIFGGRKK